jgi:hypothetical protein
MIMMMMMMISGGDKDIKVVTEIRCEILGWPELAQGGEETGLIHGGKKHLGFTIHKGFYFDHNNAYQRVKKYFVFSTQATTVKTLCE